MPKPMYEYGVLQTNEIRLLKLECASSAAKLHDALLHVTLDDSVAYEAVSYTWGSAAQSSSLQLAEGVIPITPNLASALTHFRLPDRPRLLWVDQICINQADFAERSHQVSLMTNIYTLATRVQVWIGELDDEAESAFTFLPVMLKKVRIHTPDSSYPPADPVVSLGLPVLGAPAWTALSDIFARPYFRRVWIVQEVVLARRDRIFVNCGTWQTTWEDLALASRQYEFNPQYSNAHDAVAMINRTRLTRLRDKQQSSLQDLLFEAYFLRCGDPRDKVYGIMGLTDSQDLIADYSLSVEQVYEKAARKLISDGGDLSLLGSVIHPHTRDLPSWVPDWSSKISIRQRITPSSSLLKFAREDQSSLYKQESFDLYGGTLSVFYNSLGKIESVTEAMHPLASSEVLSQWEDMARSAGQNGNITFPETYWRALLAIDDSAADSKTAEQGEECYSAWQYNMDTRFLGRNRDENFTDASGHVSLTELNRRGGVFNNLMEAHCIGRKLMLTTSGSLVLGPETATLADEVCWIDGCPTPVILRDVNANRKCVIGACYMQGFMFGPAKFDRSFERKRIQLV